VKGHAKALTARRGRRAPPPSELGHKRASFRHSIAQASMLQICLRLGLLSLTLTCPGAGRLTDLGRGKGYSHLSTVMPRRVSFDEFAMSAARLVSIRLPPLVQQTFVQFTFWRSSKRLDPVSHHAPAPGSKVSGTSVEKSGRSKRFAWMPGPAPSSDLAETTPPSHIHTHTHIFTHTRTQTRSHSSATARYS